MTTIRCAAWRVSLTNGETFVRDYATPQPEAVALACVPNVTRAEPIGEVFEPKPRRRRTPRPAAATAEPATTSTRRTRPAALEIPDELARWCWPPLLTEIVTRHFEGAS